MRSQPPFSVFQFGDASIAKQFVVRGHLVVMTRFHLMNGIAGIGPRAGRQRDGQYIEGVDFEPSHAWLWFLRPVHHTIPAAAATTMNGSAYV